MLYLAQPSIAVAYYIIVLSFMMTKRAFDMTSLSKATDSVDLPKSSWKKGRETLSFFYDDLGKSTDSGAMALFSFISESL